MPITIVQYFLDNFSLSHLVAYMVYTGLHPLALLGAALAGWTVWRRRQDSPGASLELAWLVVPFIAVNVGLACIESDQPLPRGFDRQIHFKHAMLLPAYSLLIARGVSVPARLVLERLSPRAATILTVLALLGSGGALAAWGYGELLWRQKSMDRELECAYPGCASRSKAMYRMSLDMGKLGLHRHDGAVEVHGLVEEDVEALIYWRQTCRLRPRPSASAPTRHIAASLPLSGFDPRRIRGSHVFKKYWLVDGCLPSSDPVPLGRGRYRFSLHKDADPGGLILAHLVGTAPATRDFRVTIGRGGEQVNAVVQRSSDTGPQEDYHAVSALFELGKLPPARGPLILKVKGFLPIRQPALVSVAEAAGAGRAAPRRQR